MSQIGWSLYYSSWHQENGTLHWFTTTNLSWNHMPELCAPEFYRLCTSIVVISDKISLAALEKSEGSWEAHRIARDLELLFVTPWCIVECVMILCNFLLQPSHCLRPMFWETTRSFQCLLRDTAGNLFWKCEAIYDDQYNWALLSFDSKALMFWTMQLQFLGLKVRWIIKAFC